MLDFPNWQPPTRPWGRRQVAWALGIGLLSLCLPGQTQGIDPNLPLSSFIAQKVGGAPVVGDQVEWNNTIWTVAVMDGNKIGKVGVRFPEGSAPGPGLFL